MATILWLLAVVLVVAGIYTILARRDILWGAVLIVVGLLVGPGGVSIFS
ncbi:MAG: GPGG-motif small membrane protein [Streptosporangiaceae bacterium]